MTASRHRHLRGLSFVTARRIRNAHLVAAVVWGPIMIPVVLLSGLKSSLPFVIAISLYANMGAHLSGWAGESAAIAAEAAHDVAHAARQDDLKEPW